MYSSNYMHWWNHTLLVLISKEKTLKYNVWFIWTHWKSNFNLPALKSDDKWNEDAVDDSGMKRNKRLYWQKNKLRFSLDIYPKATTKNTYFGEREKAFSSNFRFRFRLYWRAGTRQCRKLVNLLKSVHDWNLI